MTDKTRLTWGYARLSVDLGQAGIEDQKKDIRKYARVNGWDLPEERLLEEVARAYTQSGAPKRPQFEKLIQAAEEDPGSFRLIVGNLDRLVRDLSDFVRRRPRSRDLRRYRSPRPQHEHRQDERLSGRVS